jgi:hypothetical protein
LTFHFCSHFDHHYAVRALVMVDSLKSLGVPFRIWVLCLTEECQQILNLIKCPEIHLTSLDQLEKDYPELINAKKDRSLAEYYFTLSPYWPRWILENFKPIDSVTYLDADLLFLNSPKPLFVDVQDYSIGIIEHRFHPDFDISEHYGRFNVGWIFFKKDQAGLACLTKWSRQCLEWCKDKAEEGKFADQKYLDNWNEDFDGTYIYSHPGANVAPWNLNTHNISLENGTLMSDGQPVIFYHFQMIRALDATHVSSSLEVYKVPIDLRKKVIKWLYKPYIKKLLEKEISLKRKGVTAKAFRSSRDYSEVDKHNRPKKSFHQRIQDGEIIKIRDQK